VELELELGPDLYLIKGFRAPGLLSIYIYIYIYLPFIDYLGLFNFWVGTVPFLNWVGG
jgi:hypothetical protein